MQAILPAFLLILLLIAGFSLDIARSKNESLMKEAIARGYATWELDQEHYPPISVFTWKGKIEQQ
jgi:hypothetical protein